MGSRCQTESTEPGFCKRGTVRFVGTTKFASGVWVGIEYDEPIGKNDGSLAFLFPSPAHKFTDNHRYPGSRERNISNVGRDMACSFDQTRSKPEISLLKKLTLTKRYNHRSPYRLYDIHSFERYSTRASQMPSHSTPSPREFIEVQNVPRVASWIIHYSCGTCRSCRYISNPRFRYFCDRCRVCLSPLNLCMGDSKPS